MSACDDCLRRSDLIAAVAGRLDVEWRHRGARAKVLGLGDDALLELSASAATRCRYEAFSPGAARARAEADGLRLLCRHRRGYPDRLRELPDPPAVLHVLGDPAALAEPAAVALVGARRATPYGLEVARALGRGLSAARVPVVSGLALGVDAAAHAGALEAPGGVVAVLAGSAATPYPASSRTLHGEVARRGAVVSEMPPGARAFRWSFVARNRIIAALSAVTVVVQAAARSGSLTTADFAAELGRTVGAVPGPVTSALSAGVHELLQSGAALVRDAGDVLDLLTDATGREFASAPPPAPAADLPAELQQLLAAVEAGRGSLGELATSAEEVRAVLAGLGELEFRGLVRRGFSGRYERAA